METSLKVGEDEMRSQPAPFPLSAAIRLGAMLKPQARGGLLKGGGTCAFGAALDAVGALPTTALHHDLAHDIVMKLPARWPIIRRHVQHPLSTWRPVPLASVIVDLNDTHQQTREQIADFVESVELEAQMESERDESTGLGEQPPSTQGDGDPGDEMPVEQIPETPEAETIADA